MEWLLDWCISLKISHVNHFHEQSWKHTSPIVNTDTLAHDHEILLLLCYIPSISVFGTNMVLFTWNPVLSWVRGTEKICSVSIGAHSSVIVKYRQLSISKQSISDGTIPTDSQSSSDKHNFIRWVHFEFDWMAGNLIFDPCLAKKGVNIWPRGRKSNHFWTPNK